MTDPACPFCGPAEDQIFHRGRLVLGLWDQFPVSPGHALIVPRRHVASWFAATDEERAELMAAVADTRAAIERIHQPDGYNLGVNIGQAAGQTIFHLLVHVIPRYHGDVQAPRGGVRHVIPDKADYVGGMVRERRRHPTLSRPHRPSPAAHPGRPSCAPRTGRRWCAAATIRSSRIFALTWPPPCASTSRWPSRWRAAWRGSTSTSRTSCGEADTSAS
jgi:diadenosine tetraphosphate (Ap4A) HIT family hydrolase